MSWVAQILTLYPQMFPGPLGHSLAGKALDDGLWAIETLDIRDFASDKHRSVDDTPAGGGPGMVLRPDILGAAIDAARLHAEPDWPLVFLSPRGRPFDQAMAREWAGCGGITMLCGRFEGVDQRVIDQRKLTEISLGDFILSGGEPAAIAMLDAVVRLLPGVMGKHQSAEDESFERGLLEYPHYTRPQIWEGHEIPAVLNSGHHGKIAEWRLKKAEDVTRLCRPDLWSTYERRHKT
ncbi:tRNA (guanosine(37)-N1)-methyltransferase TrmD [Iodidimonas nitroreducens]|uniref:tRNA (guanine-N(1)-)-methyltransferase n=1 Tax=Iodidimonas nitroreducens TaxID=1236968 RepID=A0A5A7NCF5_9PROT|nr:tRNA (guanosine(37)-N1)-methyltransferase TrmD [Iodidimonas nitroreducens]GAK34283.1 tRNA (guanine-N(1)-)-methyltransferase [alpha proteobacterium Q-1]GER04739.1 tRNA (guanine-N(1)-)-methyltransferase [Iodidimonas nitroreducens]